jgi:RNA polymerase sigma-70 factor, ECF subfamily
MESDVAMHIDEVQAIFEALRPEMTGLAYRMCGSIADAEDVIQDAWLRWHAVEHATVQSPRAFLLRITMRLCLDQAKAARSRREHYVGPWLPEPIADIGRVGRDADPEGITELADDLSIALLLVLERLSPLERAAFLLHDVFDLSFGEIAKVLEREPAACRQLASRARRRVNEERPSKEVSPARAKMFIAKFQEALQAGDVASVSRMLAEDAVVIADGGGKKYAALKPIHGRQKIVRFFIGLVTKFQPPKEILRIELNGRDGFLITEHDGGVQTWCLDWTQEGLVRAIYLLRNPDKLRHVISPGVP